MRPAIDREPFAALLRRLGEVFGRTVTDGMVSAYWEALRPYDLSAIERRAKAHIARGKHFPRPVELVPPEEPKTVPAPCKTEEEPQRDVFERHGQRVLLAFLLRKQIGASAASLMRMLTVKNKLVNDYRLICQEEPEAAGELRDKLLDAFEQHYEPMSQAEVDDHLDHYQRTGRVRDLFRGADHV